MRTPALCPHCGQVLPSAASYLTKRELDVLAAWWMEGTVQKAAARAGVKEQRAKNMLAAARIRNHVKSNEALLAAHFAEVRSLVASMLPQTGHLEEVA